MRPATKKLAKVMPAPIATDQSSGWRPSSPVSGKSRRIRMYSSGVSSTTLARVGPVIAITTPQ